MEQSNVLIENLNIYPSNVIKTFPSPSWNAEFNSMISNKFFYVIEGEFILNINGKSYIVRKNQMALLPIGAHVVYSFNPAKKFAIYSCGFKAEINNIDIFQYLNLADDYHVITIDDYAKVESFFESARNNDSFSTIIGYRLNFTAEISKLIAIYVEHRLKIQPLDSTMAPVIEYMNKNLNGNITLAELADLVHLHPSYFVNKFKDIYGKPPMKYYDDLRIKKSIHLLTNSDLPISSVALEIGINDQLYFSHFFKKHSGVSPTEYRNLFLNLKKQEFFKKNK